MWLTSVFTAGVSGNNVRILTRQDVDSILVEVVTALRCRHHQRQTHQLHCVGGRHDHRSLSDAAKFAEVASSLLSIADLQCYFKLRSVSSQAAHITI